MANFITLLGIPNHVYQITGRHKKISAVYCKPNPGYVIYTSDWYLQLANHDNKDNKGVNKHWG